MFQYRAKGQELFDDAIVSRFQVWAQDKPDGVYLSSDLSDDDAARYISRRTQEIAMAPQEHFDKFIYDMIVILNREILIDFNGQSNFFYDSNVGFQFIDLDAHNDYKYGLTKQKQNIEEIVALGGFTPCHYAVGIKVFASTALDEKAMCKVGGEKLRDIRKNNRIIFEKCRVAMKNNGIPEERINSSMKKLKIYD